MCIALASIRHSVKCVPGNARLRSQAASRKATLHSLHSIEAEHRIRECPNSRGYYARQYAENILRCSAIPSANSCFTPCVRIAVQAYMRQFCTRCDVISGRRTCSSIKSYPHSDTHTRSRAAAISPQFSAISMAQSLECRRGHSPTILHQRNVS